ncbi:hypothetical protein BGZ83_000839 [Gryganskiella cystojenkinii]|nr:hypothetical protein BGZ83_000839 [Gryganskiella cystojenkinii]
MSILIVDRNNTMLLSYCCGAPQKPRRKSNLSRHDPDHGVRDDINTIKMTEIRSAEAPLAQRMYASRTTSLVFSSGKRYNHFER